MALGFQSHRRLHKRGCHKCGDKGLATAPHSKKHGPLGMLNLQRKTDEIRMIQTDPRLEGTGRLKAVSYTKAPEPTKMTTRSYVL